MDKWTMESSIWGCPCCLATTGGLSYCSLVGGRVGGWQLPAAPRRLRCQQLAGNATCGSMRTATATKWLQWAPPLCRSSTTAGGTSPIGHRSASATSQALKVRAGGQQGCCLFGGWQQGAPAAPWGPRQGAAAVTTCSPLHTFLLLHPAACAPEHTCCRTLLPPQRTTRRQTRMHRQSWLTRTAWWVGHARWRLPFQCKPAGLPFCCMP